MILHIFTTENSYQISFIRFIEKHFPWSQHQFVFRSKTVNKNNYHQNLSIVKKTNFLSLILFTPQLLRAEKVLLHYLPYGPSLPYWVLYSFFRKNLVWIYWGGDIYIHEDRNKNLKCRFYEYCRRVIINRIRNIAGFLNEDFEIIKMNYKTKAIYSKAIYPLPTNFSLLEKNIPNSKISLNNTIRILIGNSADLSNNHLELLDLLSKFKNEDIELFCPLSYGSSKEFISIIVKEGHKIFGNKFVPILELLSIDDYCRFLGSIDISIMNHKRQQGLGNLISLLWLGKKVYVRSDTTSFTYFKSEGIIVSDTLDIKNLSFEEFVSLDTNDAFKNKSIVLNVFSNENYFKLWNNVFNLK